MSHHLAESGLVTAAAAESLSGLNGQPWVQRQQAAGDVYIGVDQRDLSGQHATSQHYDQSILAPQMFDQGNNTSLAEPVKTVELTDVATRQWHGGI